MTLSSKQKAVSRKAMSVVGRGTSPVREGKGEETHEEIKSSVWLYALCSLRFASPPRRSSRRQYRGLVTLRTH